MVTFCRMSSKACGSYLEDFPPMLLGPDHTQQDHVRNLSHPSKPSAAPYPTSSFHLAVGGEGGGSFATCPRKSFAPAPAVPGSSGQGLWGIQLLKQPSLLSKICPLPFFKDLQSGPMWVALPGKDRPLSSTKATHRRFEGFLGKGLYSESCSKTSWKNLWTWQLQICIPSPQPMPCPQKWQKHFSWIKKVF